MRVAGIVLSLFTAGSLLQAQTSVPLLENWPFTPPGKAQNSQTNAENASTSLAKLQLRGITSVDGEYIFSIYDPDLRESHWISQGQELAGLVIQSYDVERNSVVIHSEAENLSRQMQMNDYAAPTGLRASPTPARPSQTSATGTANRTTPQSVSPTGTLTRTQQSVQRPTRRNLETLRARRAELAEKLRKQPKPGETNPAQGSTNQSNRD